MTKTSDGVPVEPPPPPNEPSDDDDMSVTTAKIGERMNTIDHEMREFVIKFEIQATQRCCISMHSASPHPPPLRTTRQIRRRYSNLQQSQQRNHLH